VSLPRCSAAAGHYFQSNRIKYSCRSPRPIAVVAAVAAYTHDRVSLSRHAAIREEISTSASLFTVRSKATAPCTPAAVDCDCDENLAKDRDTSVIIGVWFFQRNTLLLFLLCFIRFNFLCTYYFLIGASFFLLVAQSQYFIAHFVIILFRKVFTNFSNLGQ